MNYDNTCIKNDVCNMAICDREECKHRVEQLVSPTFLLAQEWQNPEVRPNNTRHVIVHYICHGIAVQTTAYYDPEYKHWYDWCGDRIEEVILGWREKLPSPTQPTPKKIKGEFIININKNFYKKLNYDKIRINWNKKPIKMDLFLSFLTVNVVQRENHLGHDTGWTLYENEDIRLQIMGGRVGENEYLESIQYGEKLQNNYNNYVNPFYIFEILNEEGKLFFIYYYMDDILSLIDKQNEILQSLKNKIESERNVQNEYIKERELLFGLVTAHTCNLELGQK